MTRWKRSVVAAAGAVALLGGSAPAVHAAEAPAPKAEEPQLLLVHGHGNPAKGYDCNGTTWATALDYFTDQGGMDPNRITTVGYYEGSASGGPNDGTCDAQVAKATAKSKIQDIAKGLANYVHDEYTSKGRSVNIAAHSMGGLVTRVALLGTAEGWSGFPSSMKVDNVVTTGTPHQGVKGDLADTEQAKQMQPGSGFLDALHEDGRELGDSWTKGTDWTLIGSNEDDVVSYNSAIDKGNRSNQKFGYKDNESHNGTTVGHSELRTTKGPPHNYKLSYWSASDGQEHTTNGWAPLKALFKAATEKGDGLP